MRDTDTDTGTGTETGHDGHDDADEGYDGPATLVVGDEELSVEVLLRYRHEPFDGRLHWAGRVRAHRRLGELVGDGAADVAISTGGDAAAARISEPDPWSRYRIAGVGPPPFEVDPPPADD